MSVHEEKITQALIEVDDWMTIRQLAEHTKIEKAHIYRVFKRRGLSNLDKKRVRTSCGKNSVCYRIPKSIAESKISALELAKKNQGVFGQLFWCNNG